MFVVSLVVIISAVDCLKRLVSEVTCYVSSGMSSSSQLLFCLFNVI